MRSTHHELLARNSIQAHPKSYGLSPSSPTPQIQAYTSYELENDKPTTQQHTHKHRTTLHSHLSQGLRLD